MAVAAADTWTVARLAADCVGEGDGKKEARVRV